ncbi:helix-turn-helix domain-containing protein [Candidatus Moduliflexota bacterium]
MGAKKSSPKLGATVRRLREAKEITLRAFAVKVGVSPTYISFLERDELKTPPREEVIRSIAGVLKQDEDELLALAGRIAGDLSDAIAQNPREMAAFLRVAKDLPGGEIEKLAKTAQKRRADLAKKDNK